MLKIEPQSDGLEKLKSYYKKTNSPNPDPIKPHEAKNIDTVISHYITESSSQHIVTDVNNKAADAPKFSGFFDQAISVTSALKAEREQARRSTMTNFVERFGNFLRGGGQAPKPPTAQPPSPGPNQG